MLEPIAASPAAGPTKRSAESSKGIHWLIWVYFFLLIAEGALRKWVFPGLANQLLLIRAPVVLGCYFVAIRAGRFPKNAFVSATIILGLASVVISCFVTPVGSLDKFLIITLFGLQANFLHLPLIFLIRDTFDRERLRAVAMSLMILAPLMAVIVFLQYLAGPDAWINAGAGVGSEQIGAGINGSDKIRPAGLFSYNTGLGCYLALLAAFVLHQMMGARRYPRIIFVTATASLVITAILSISRTTALSVSIVYAAAALSVIFIPRLFSRAIIIIGVVGMAAILVAKFSILGEGISILQARVEESGGVKEGGIDRFLGVFTEAFQAIESVSLFGSGLGLGTNAAGQVMTGQRAFYLNAESEWTRVLMECGAILGSAYILLRVALCIYLAKTAWVALRQEQPLPLLLLSACFINVLMGQFGIPMTVGFAVFTAGLVLAAAKEPAPVMAPALAVAEGTPEVTERRAKIRGRSAYAERLHGGKFDL